MVIASFRGQVAQAPSEMQSIVQFPTWVFRARLMRRRSNGQSAYRLKAGSGQVVGLSEQG